MTNTTILLGRLTKDVETRYTASQMAVARFTLAVDRANKEKGADFISCVAFGKTAEAMEKFTGKGLRIALQGHIQTGSYEKDGQKVYTTDVIADRVDFIDWKDSKKSEDNPVSEFEALDAELPFQLDNGCNKEGEKNQ